MSYWNYRVIESFDTTGEPLRAIHEVHYDDDGNLEGYSENPVSMVLSGESSSNDGLAWILEKMAQALEKPVLKESDFFSGDEGKDQHA